jgi:hypothetical protein
MPIDLGKIPITRSVSAAIKDADAAVVATERQWADVAQQR